MADPACVDRRDMTSKEKRAAYAKLYRRRNKAKIAAYDTEYCQANRVVIAAKKKVYREETRAECAAYGKGYRATHKDSIAARVKAWQEEHKGEFDTYSKAYYAKNKDAILSQHKGHYAENKVEILAQQKAWRQANPDKCADISARKRARKRGATVENVSKAEVYERDGGRCHLCGKRVPKKDWHLDHIVPLARGGEHSYKNVAVSCPACNMSKGANLVKVA